MTVNFVIQAHRPHLQASPIYKQTACELRESSNSKLKHHTQQAALAVEASLEAGSTFDTMDQFYDGESLMQRSDSSDGDTDDGVAAWASHSSALTPISRERQQSSTMDFPFFSPYTVFRGNGNSVA
ncbi:hypothetical protein BDR07DRAFT_1495014 [Suillus spraguei]|nr:hypothetical protein BDR07DRAFT_1495014 [Suillus spraguei]